MKSLPKLKYIIYVILTIIIIGLLIVITFLVIEQKSKAHIVESPSIEDNTDSTKTQTSNDVNLSMQKEIEEAAKKSEHNKSQYKSKYLYYMGLERYTGTQVSYNAKINQLDKDISQAYVDCTCKVSSIDPRLSEIGRKSLKIQYEKERDDKISQILTEKSELKEAWKNQQNYLQYYSLYLNEDEKLAQEIERIKDKYNSNASSTR